MKLNPKLSKRQLHLMYHKLTSQESSDKVQTTTEEKK